MKRKIFGLAIIAGLIAGCSSKPEENLPDNPSFYLWSVLAEETFLRAGPGFETPVSETLSKGTLLNDLDEVSPFFSVLRRGNIALDEPWLKVQTENKKEGWVFVGDLGPAPGQDSAWALRKRNVRLQALFGESGFEQLMSYRENFGNIADASGFAMVYRQGMALRDTLVRQINARLLERTSLPDLFWLKAAIPGFVLQLVAEGTAYFLFVDYNVFRKLAVQTPQPEDDAFVEFCLHVFPEDSIEYFFPAWTIQTTDHSGHSLLGRGIHRKLLDRISAMAPETSLFRPELNAFKQQLVHDMTSAKVTYWETREKILAEVEAIWNTNYALFSDVDRIALETRFQQFREPEKYGIETNHKAGIYE